MKRIEPLAHLSVFLRSFLIQGSWNNRTMIGGGFAFAILPVLRRLTRATGERLGPGLQRHSEHFNAHPYLADLALGAACKMEEEGADPEEIRRFKIAVRGPLGSLGDALIWVGWRPATVLAALSLALVGVPPLWVATFFLVLYNLGHISLRIWGFRAGLARGSQVGDSLRFLALPRQADRITSIGVFLLGVVAGLVLGHGVGADPVNLLWAFPAALGLWIGARARQRVWSPLVWGMSALIVLVVLGGWVG
jgi:PTS system mannose-specific IID component